MDKISLLKISISVFSDFEIVWNSESNFFREKVDFTSSGVCAEFSHYFQENYAEFSDTQLKTLFDKIEEISAQENTDEVATALYTCFLENIAQTESGSFAKQFMGKRSEEFFNSLN